MDDDVAAAFAISDEFLRTFNALDAAGHAATLAYPHVRLASGTVRIGETVEEEATAQITTNMALIPERLGWGHSEWDHKELLHAGPGKVVETDDGWRIQARSSYAP